MEQPSSETLFRCWRRTHRKAYMKQELAFKVSAPSDMCHFGSCLINQSKSHNVTWVKRTRIYSVLLAGLLTSSLLFVKASPPPLALSGLSSNLTIFLLCPENFYSRASPVGIYISIGIRGNGLREFWNKHMTFLECCFYLRFGNIYILC